MWATGTATAVYLLNKDGGKDGQPQPPPEVNLRGAFIPLEGTPADVATGDFIRSPAGVGDGKSPLDVAVLPSDRLSVRFFAGDGSGRLREDIVVSLSENSSLPCVGLAVVKGSDAGGDGLVVTTATSLEYLEWSAASGAPEWRQTIPLAYEEGRRDVEVGDFDGNGVPDVAVSSPDGDAVQVFPGSSADGSVVFDASPAPVREVTDWGSIEASFHSPCALAAADFDRDGSGRTDLAVLVVEAQVPLLKLYVSTGDGLTLRLQDQLAFRDAEIDTGAALEALDGASFEWSGGEATDPYPDLLLNRESRVCKVLVSGGEDGRVKLSNYPQASGPDVRKPVSPAFIQLPRGGENGGTLWDVACVDPASGTVAVVYSDESDGIGAGDRAEYAVPGVPQALAVGDLDGNGFDDVVAVSVQPSVLSVLLANAAEEETLGDPLFRPFARNFGENLPPELPSPLVYGAAEDSGPKPFLAVLAANGAEVVIVYIDPETWQEVDRETHREISGLLSNLYVADLDGLPGDEIVAVTKTADFYLLRKASSEIPRYALDTSFSILDLPSRTCGLEETDPCQEGPPPILSRKKYQLRFVTIADLDADGALDFALPLTIKGFEVKEDYIALVFHPLAGPEATFYETGDDPRCIAACNLDGDGARDLLVACEGADPDRGNRIHVLLGDADAPGSFRRRGLEAPWAVPGPCRSEPGQEECIFDELEFIVTENDVTGFDAPARAVAVSMKTTVQVYFNRSLPGEPSLLIGSSPVYEGMDPEYLVLRDVCGDSDPELFVGDEDAETISACVWEGFLDPGQDRPENPWGIPRPIGGGASKDRFILAKDPGGSGATMFGYLSSDGRIVLCWAQEGACGYDRRVSIPVEKADSKGGRLGLVSARCGDGSLILASAVEDDDRPTALGAVDLVRFPAKIDMADALSVGKTGSSIPASRFLLAPGIQAGSVLLGSLTGVNPFPDLLVHDPKAHTASCWMGSEDPAAPPPGDPEPAAFEPFAGDPECRLDGIGALLGWELPGAAEPAGTVLMVTGQEVALRSPCAQIADRVLCRAEGIRCAACGRAGADPQRREVSFVALLARRGLEIHVLESGKGTVPAPGVTTGIVGCHDLDGDRRDDVVLIDPTATTLRVFHQREAFSFGESASFDYGSTAEPVGVAFPDLNGDGRPEVCFATSDGFLHAFLGDGRFLDDRLSAVRLTSTYAGPKPEAILAEDLDGDGRDEILASVEFPGLVILSDWSRE
jgi:hypothetical protein